MIKGKTVVLSLVSALGGVIVTPTISFAASAAERIQTGVNDVGGASETPLDIRFDDIVNILLFIVAAIAVIMIVVGAIRYTTSTGDSSRLKAAKDTIMYAVAGLVLSIIAYAIVNFVINAFLKGAIV